VVNEADLMQTVLALVEAGEGVALVPGCVVVRPTVRESAALRSFLGVVREHAENIGRMVAGGAGC